MEIDIRTGNRVHYDIETERLILRQSIDSRDLDSYISHLKSADEFYAQYGYDYSEELEQAIDFYSSGVIYYTVFLKDTDEMIGYVGINPDRFNNSGDLEFYIFSEHRRKHYAAESIQAMIKWYFCEEIPMGKYSKNAKTITAETLEDNTPSRRLLECLGFERTATGFRFSDFEQIANPDTPNSITLYVRYELKENK